jgi:hypothetical protein
MHSSEDLEAFVFVYMSQKQSNSNTSIDIEELLQKHNVSQERYAELFRRSQTNQRASLSNEENDFLQDLEKANKNLLKAKQKNLKKSCKDSSIEYDNYMAILNKYKSSIAFQRSLKPYFDHYINQRK